MKIGQMAKFRDNLTSTATGPVRDDGPVRSHAAFSSAVDSASAFDASQNHDAAVARQLLHAEVGGDPVPAPADAKGVNALVTPGSPNLDLPDYFYNADERGGVEPVTGKVSKTVAQAAYWLDRTYATWNAFSARPGVADENNHWDDPFWGGATTYVTFAFRSSAPISGMPDDTGGFSAFSAAQINATLLALQSWSDVANIVFIRVGTGTSGPDAYSNDATMLYGNYATGAAGAAAFAYSTSSTASSSSGGDVWVNNSLSYNADPQAGNYGQLVLLHESGHAIGFSHPGDYDAGDNATITYAANAEYYEDSQQYTVMSYFTENRTGAYFGPLYPATIMLDDIAAAQRSYGVNMNTRTGDTVYGFNSTADRPWFLATSTDTIVIFAVWDAGGNDTFDFSGYTAAATINLNQGCFSNVGGYVGNVAIAMGVSIENAIGGSGGDVLIGNDLANRLTGNAGQDTMEGRGGADVFVVTNHLGSDIILDFQLGVDRIDLSAFGGYLSIDQSEGNPADAIITFSNQTGLILKNIQAASLTAASFVGMTWSPPPPPPSPPPGTPPDGFNLINGTSTTDTLNGTAARDQIYGKGGFDTLNGGDMSDWLDGGADDDTLNGDAGDDFLFGGAGDDRLNGGSGADSMTGGAGNDTYTVDDLGDAVVEVAGGGGRHCHNHARDLYARLGAGKSPRRRVGPDLERQCPEQHHRRRRRQRRPQRPRRRRLSGGR